MRVNGPPEVLADAAAGAASDAVRVARKLHALLQHQHHRLHRYHAAAAEEAALRVLHLRQETGTPHVGSVIAHAAISWCAVHRASILPLACMGGGNSQGGCFID